MDLEKALQNHLLYAPERRVVKLADALATDPGGDYPNVLRSGQRRLPAGRKLKAEVLDMNSIDDTTPARKANVFALTILDDGDHEVEVAWVAPELGDSFYAETAVQDPHDDPDGAERQQTARQLQAFLRRHELGDEFEGGWHF